MNEHDANILIATDKNNLQEVQLSKTFIVGLPSCTHEIGLIIVFVSVDRLILQAHTLVYTLYVTCYVMLCYVTFIYVTAVK